MIFFRNYIYFLYLRERKLINMNYEFLLSGRTFWTISNLAIVFIIPNHVYHENYGKNYNFETGLSFYYRRNDTLVIGSMIRIIPITLGLLVNSDFSNVRIHRLSRLIGTEYSYQYIMKMIFNQKPYKFLFLCLIISIFFFAFALRVSELPLNQVDQAFDFSQYAVMYWLTIVTMTTVGYGDYFPRTIPGRCFAFILCIWGVFILGLMIVFLQEILILSEEE